ncbi:uncharacterized protein LACBIDRAFT_315235 [Laccaria bicolor S238N-H82]|uniref:Predicted protein n=1 Tax=Laccaria bicolor (strain S238N-H82 / ATCC MYA-4686) TaxID=486041 RepID=B0E050_LACBS|nr:uncharacterized protein LACBIDRAFT_315235 [Laccaria bicolor S238N-H82]EDQ99726.1 predicted protein [Laccaria bicolor S238N-H82]|eukprot:XP_001889562.1 predicted protein [Laccaria bicolor S238N-H82]
MDGMLGSSFASLTQQAQCHTYFQVVIMAAVLYDHVITLDIEVELIWVWLNAGVRPAIDCVHRRKNGLL